MRVIKFLILGLTISALSSCQTFQGLGRDVQRAGNGLENAATR